MGRSEPRDAATSVDRPWRRYRLYFLIWTLGGLFFFTQDLSRKAYWGDPTPAWQFLVSWMLGVWLMAAMTPSILWLGRRWPIARRGWPARVALHAACSFGFGLLQVVLVSAAASVMGFLGALRLGSVVETVPVLFVLTFHNNVVSYWTVLGLQHGLRYYRRYQEREKQALRLELHASELQTQLVRARLGALKMQLQPHFLFNTMYVIHYVFVSWILYALLGAALPAVAKAGIAFAATVVLTWATAAGMRRFARGCRRAPAGPPMLAAPGPLDQPAG
jgi:hypothetical protein